MTFLPYQHAWINDRSRLCLAEKSVRIGWTFADALKNVLKRLDFPRRDYLFASKDQPTALEYVKTCFHFCEFLNYSKSIISYGTDHFQLPIFHDDHPTAFTEELKVGYIKFDNGSRILAFSSNPNAIRAYGGDVGLDEFAFHPNQQALYAAASGRVTWGFDLAIWSSHNGDDTLFYQFTREASLAPLKSEILVRKSPWSHYRVTILDAIAAGLVEKINAAAGAHFTRDQFLADCKLRARLPEIFEQEYLCNPCSSTHTIVPWSTLQLCQHDYPIERLHLEDLAIPELFGRFHPDSAPARALQIEQFLSQAFPAAFSARASRHFLGFDVAASGHGHLAVIYIDRLVASHLQLVALLSCRTQDWHFLKSTLHTFLRRLPNVRACGDETGLGRQICWETASQFPGAFTPVNFSVEKSNLGFALMNQLAAGEKRFPAAHPDIAADFFALRKHYTGARWLFTESSNPLNPNSHCDLAWAAALASKARLATPAIQALVIW